MVAIVAGNGLGLFNTSLDILGEAGVLGQSALGQGSSRAIVNAATGNLVLQMQDEQLAGRGLDLYAVRTCNSLGAPDDGDADGWRWGYEQTVRFQGPGTPAQPHAGATVIRTDGDGHETAYSWDAARAAYLGTEGSGAHDELRYDGAPGEWVRTDGSTRVTERYSNSTSPGETGRLIERTDTSGNSIVVSYDAGRLTRIRDAGSHQELRLEYGTFSGATRVQRLDTRALVEDPSGSATETLGGPVRQVRYDYDSSGRLTTVTRVLTPAGGSTADGPVFVTTYAYDGAAGRIASVTASDGSSVFFTYDGAGRVSKVTDHSGATDAQLVLSYSPATSSTNITDGNGQVWTYRYDATTQQLTEIRTPAVGGARLSTRFAYGASGNLLSITDARSNTVTYGYDGNGNRVLERDALGNTVTRTFSAANQKLTQTRYRIPDPDGAGPQHAGDPLTARYAYDGNSRLRFVVSPEGCVTENRYGTASAGYGLLMHTLQYTGQVYDVAGLGPDAELTEAQLAAWVAALPDKTRARLTEYRYDLRGNVSRQMIYATVDAAGAGVLDDQASVTEYRYDAHGRLGRRTVVRGSARDERFVVASFGYDGMGRVVTSTDASGTQTTGYDDAGGRITVTTTSGLTETREYDSRGRLVRVSQAGEATTGAVTTRQTRYVYDNGDQLRMAEDAQGGRRYRFYDAIGRLEFAVDAAGAVTRSEYNATGQVIRQTLYLNRADPGTWFDSATQTVTKLSLAVGGAGGDLPADPERDRVTTFEYDAAGRLTRTTDAAGTVTTTRYDGGSRVTMTQTGDRVTRHLYDKDDRKAGAVDPLGYLTEYRYDAGGSLIETARYGQRSPAAANTSAPVWVGVTSQNAIAGKPFEYHVPACDPDGDQLTVSVVGTPPGWLSFDAPTATLRGTAPAAAGTDHQVTLRADDGRGKTSDVTVLISVINPPRPSTPGAGPAWAPLSPLAVTTDIPVSYVVPAATGPSLMYRVVSGLPAGLSFNPADRTISGRASGAGFSTIVLRATSVSGQSVDRTLPVQIRAAATAPDQPAGSDELPAWRPADVRGLRSYLYYDGRGRVVGSVDERQFLTETVHDEARNTQRTLRYLTPVTVGPGDTLASLKSRAGAVRQTSLVEYDGFGRVLVTTGPDGSTQTRNEYDQAGRLTRAVNAADTAEQRARRTFRNAFGEVTATLGGEGDASLGTNPSPEQISEAIRDYGTRSEYDTLGRPVRAVDANGNKTLLYYDRENRLTHTISVLGHSASNTLAGEVSETTYTSFGQTASVRRYATRLTDADMDQLLAGGGGLAGQFLLSTLAALADPDLDSVTSYEYDRNGRLEREIDSEGGVTVNAYNPHGELAAQVRSLSAGRSTTTQVDYDLAGRVLSRTGDVGGINANTQTAYDAFGRITRSADELGHVTTTAHQDSGRIVVVTDPLRRATRTEYEAFGRVLSTVNALNERTKYSYGDAARSVTVTTPEEIQVTTTRTRHGELASITDGRGNTTSYSYNKDGQQTTVTDPLGQVTTKTTYDRSGRTHEVIDARGTVTRLSYDQRNRVTERRVGPTGLNLTGRFEFDALGRQVQVTDGANTAAARTITYLYDRKGRVRKEVVDPGGLRLCTSYGYDHRDNIVTVARGTVSSPNQHVTQHQFDSLGRQTKEIAAPSPVFGAGPSGTRDLTTQYRYDAAGRVIRRIEANGQSTWQVYDAAAQLTHAISALGDVSETRYDAAGRPVYRRRCASRLGPSTVDGFGDTVGSFTSPTAHRNDQLSHVVYDHDGRPRFTLVATGSSGWTISENRHDANANIVEKRRYDKFLPNARVMAIDFAGSPGITVPEIQGELSALGYHDNAPSTLAGVPRTRFAYDASNRLRFTVDPLGSIAESAYDPAGNVVSATRFASRPALPGYTESAIDAVVDRTEIDNSVTRHAYDAVGRLRYTVDALGSVRENRYDARGNLVTRARWATRPKLTQYSESAITAALASLPANGDDVTHLVYDAGNRLRFTIDALGSITENGYDAVGNVLVTTRFAGRPAAPIPAYTEGEVNAAVDPLRGDGANQVTRFAHDPSDRLRFTIDALGSVTEKVYDAVGNVVVTTRFAVRPALHQYSESAIDAAVAPRRADGANSTTRFVYDGVNRLRYTIDALGSITERVYDTVGNPNRVLRLAVRPPLTAYSEGALNAAVAPQRDNPGNQVQHSVYDAAGQVRFTLQRVSVEAGQFRYSATRHELDALGQSVGTISYATAVPLSSFSEPAVSAAVGSGDAAKDHVSRFVYDLAGHQSYALSALTFEANSRRYQVTAQQFDAFGRRVRSTTYATAVAVSAFDQAAIDAAVSAVADPTRDRFSAAAYDPLDQMVYDVRLLGPDRHQVVQQEYDALGRIVKTTRYARAVGPLATFDRASLDSAVSAIAAANDRKTLYVYDAAGRQRFTLQTDSIPRWTISESRYDTIGNVIESRRYDRHVTDAWIAAADTADSPGINEHEVLDQLSSLGYSDGTPSTLVNLQRTRFAYDVSNRLRFTVDALGGVVETVYDSFGDLTATTRFAARPDLTDVSESAIEEAVDRGDTANRVQHLAYDPLGQLRFTVQLIATAATPDTAHLVEESRYDAFGQLIERRAYADTVGDVAGYGEADIAAAIVPDPVHDHRSAVAYDAGGRQVFAIRGLWAETGTTYLITRRVPDALGQVVQQVDYATAVPLAAFDLRSVEAGVVADPAVDRVTTQVRDAAGRQRFEIRPDLSFAETVYDALDQVTETRRFDFRAPDGTPRSEADMSTLRGSHAVGDGSTRGERATYDAGGRRTSSTDALGNTEHYKPDALGDRVRWTDRNDNVWSCTYDRKGRKSRETTPPVAFILGAENPGTPPPERVVETTMDYDAFGHLVRKAEAANLAADASTTDYLFDTLGRPTTTLHPGYYDTTTGVVEREPGHGRFRQESSILYDVIGNVVRTSDRTGADAFVHTHRTFDNQGRVEHEVNALNHVTRYTYTAFAEQASVTRHSVTISKPPQNGVFWSPGEIESQLNLGVDELGNVLEDVYARTVNLAYDTLGRKVGVTMPEATYYSTQMPGDPSQANEYRPNPESASGVEDSAATRYEYDAFGQVLRQRVRANVIVEWQDTTFSHDALGRQTFSRDAAGNVTTNHYDVAGNLARQSEIVGFGDGTDRISVYAYDLLDHQVRVDRYGLRYTDADGIDHGIAYWTWDDGGHWVDPDADVPTIAKTAGYDPYGHPLTVTDAAGNSTTMRYDALGRLVETVAPVRLVAPLAANGEEAVDPFRGQLPQTLVATLTLDPFGRIRRQASSAAEGEDARMLAHEYDARGNLVADTDAEGNLTRRAYDPLGRVIRETRAIHADLGPLGINEEGIERRYVYDALGQLTHTLDVYLDGDDQVQTGKSVAYNAFGEVELERHTWGPADRAPEALDAAISALTQYDKAGHPIDRLAPDGLTVYFHNLLGKVTREEKRGNFDPPDGTATRITETQYDVLGRPIIVRRPAFDATVLSETLPQPVTPYSRHGYDRWGNVTVAEDAGYRFKNGQPVFDLMARRYRFYSYDDNNRIVTESLSSQDFIDSTGAGQRGILSRLSFRDLLGNVVRETEEVRDDRTDVVLDSRTRSMRYDTVGHLIADTDATGITNEYAHNVHGDRLGTRNPHGTVRFDRCDRNGNIRFHGVLCTTSPTGPGEYDSHTGAGTPQRTYLNAHQYDQAGRRFASKTFREAADAPWTYTWLDARNLGVRHSDAVGLVTRFRFDQFGNKAAQVDSGGARTEWDASTEDYTVGRIERYRQPSDTGLAFGQYSYTRFGEVKFHLLGNARTEFGRHRNGLLSGVFITPDTTGRPSDLEITNYEYDALGQVSRETRIVRESVTSQRNSIQIREVLHDGNGRLLRVQDQNKVPRAPLCDVRYDYDAWGNIRRIGADVAAQPPWQDFGHIENWYDYDRAGRLIVDHGELVAGEIRPQRRPFAGVRIGYDEVGRRSSMTEFVAANTTSVGSLAGEITRAKPVDDGDGGGGGGDGGGGDGGGGIVRTWDTLRDERYAHDDLGHLRLIEQRIRNVDFLRTDLGSGESVPEPSRTGTWQTLSVRSSDLRGDVTRIEHWTRIAGVLNRPEVDEQAAALSTTTTSYRENGQVAGTRSDAVDPKHSTETSYAYDPETGLLDSYVFNASRSDGAPVTATFSYQYAFQNGQRVVAHISDPAQGLHTRKSYDPLGRLASERVDLQRQDGNGSDLYDQRTYEFSGDGRTVFKTSELRLSSSGPGHEDLPNPSSGEQTYVYAKNRLVATVGSERLTGQTRVGFAYTRMSEARTESSQYVVQPDDSLVDIASATYGDGGLWPVIADANGVSFTGNPDQPLPSTETGKPYEIPGMTSNKQSTTAFRPYALTEILGEDRPFAIPVPPPPHHSDLEIMGVTALSLGLQIGSTAILSGLGVPAPISAAIGSGLGNLAGQGLAGELGMRPPDQHGIDWTGVGAAAMQGSMFSITGPGVRGALAREVFQQGWTSSEHSEDGTRGDVTRSGIARSLFNIGLDAFGSALGGPQFGKIGPVPPSGEPGYPFTFGLGELYYGAFNLRSGWAIPGSQHSSPAVGAFEYAYGAVANGLANLGYGWIRNQIDRPSPPVQPPPAVGQDRGRLSAEQLDLWDEMDRQLDRKYTQEFAEQAQRARDQQIAAEIDERFARGLKWAQLDDLVSHYGEDIDDRDRITAAIRQRNAEERARRQQAQALARERAARREAILARNTANLLKEQAAKAREAALYWDHLARDDAEFATQQVADMVSQGTYTPVERYVGLDGFPLARYTTPEGSTLTAGSTVYDRMSSRPNLFMDELQHDYEQWRKADPRLAEHQVIDMYDINTPASQSRRGEGADVKTFSQWRKLHPNEPPEGYLVYHAQRDREVVANWREGNNAAGAVLFIAKGTLGGLGLLFDPIGTIGSFAAGYAAERTLRAVGFDAQAASEMGGLVSELAGLGIGHVQARSARPSVSDLVQAQRLARAEFDAARFTRQALEFEASKGIRLAEDVTLFKNTPAAARAAQPAFGHDVGLPASGGHPANPGRGLVVSPGPSYSWEFQPRESDLAIGPMHRENSPLIRGFEYRSRSVAYISDGFPPSNAGDARFAAANAAIAYATREGAPTISAASLGTIGTTESKPYFRLLSLRKISDPVNGMTGILHRGRFLKSTERGIGALEWLENPLYLEAGHGNSAWGLGSPGAQTAAGGLRLQTAYLNRFQSATIEHPSLGGIARNSAALSIRGVPFDVMTARDLAAYGAVDPDMVAISPLIRFFDF